MSRSLIATLAHRYGPRPTSEERRRFLQLSLATGAGLLLSSSAFAQAGKPAKGGKRVVVIGAGFAGLACAFELKSVGYDVTLLDPRERVGGRVLSFNAAFKNEFVPGRNVEGGAELIGSNHPMWVTYAERFKLEFLDVGDDPEAAPPVVLGDTLLDYEEAGKLWEEMEGALGHMNELAADVPEDEPWKAKDAQRLDKTSIAAFVASLKDVSDRAKAGMLINQESDNGQDPAKQSLLGQLAAVKGGGLEKFWTDSEVYRCKGGNSLLAKALSEAIGLDRIILGLAARSISVKGNTVVVEASDGRKIECDDVVLTAPPPVWNKIDIAPALPAAMNPQMGLNSKYLAHVKSRFWEKHGPKLSQYALSDGMVHMTWEGTDGQEGDAPAALVAFSGGRSCQKALDLPKDQRDGAFAAILEKFFPGYNQNFVASRFMDWPKDKWAGASYSFPAPGQVTSVGPLMAQSHLGGRLHIAGEHTCYKFVGYMEGALSSGAAVARRLAARDGLAKPTTPAPTPAPTPDKAPSPK